MSRKADPCTCHYKCFTWRRQSKKKSLELAVPFYRRALPETSLGEWSRREIETALEMLERDTHAAANAGAQLLRIYVARRHGGRTEAATTEELARQTPTLAQRSLWPDFVGILHNLDDVRFRPNADGREGRRRTRRALEDARRLVDASSTDRGRASSTNGRARDAT